jgi:hypothetical protein
MKQSLRLTLIESALVGLTAVSLAACSSSPPAPIASPTDSTVDQSTQSPPPVSSPAPSPTPSVSASPTPAAPAPGSAATSPQAPAPRPDPVKIATSNTSNQEITVYKLDDQCNGYVPEKLPMPTQGTMEAIVAKVLENSNTPDFNVSNYRVDVKDGVATVDLRLPANAKRPFTALSACEQMGLLGSLEKTLKENSSLKIQAVRFTDGKQELQF